MFLDYDNSTPSWKVIPLHLIKTKLGINLKFHSKAHISSNFRYCPIIWMFCGKMSDNLIVKTDYRTLRAIYDTQTR